MSLWQHLFPPFDAWWPNIIASLVWTVPAFIGQHVAMRRHHRRVLTDHLDALRRHQADAAKRHADVVTAMVGEFLGEARDKIAEHVAERVADQVAAPPPPRRRFW